jgi:type III restriction enzyme
MELKEYQQNTLKRVKAYLEALKNWRVKNEKVVAAIGKDAALDVPLKAWEEIGGKNYRSRKNGIGEPLPNFCLKIPTGGGKTLLAAHTVDLVNRKLPAEADRPRAVGDADHTDLPADH